MLASTSAANNPRQRRARRGPKNRKGATTRLLPELPDGSLGRRETAPPPRSSTAPDRHTAHAVGKSKRSTPR